MSDLKEAIYSLADCIKDLSCMIDITDEFIKDRLINIYERAKNIQENL